VGLLLLRAAIGLLILTQGGFSLSAGATDAWVAVAGIAAGAALLFGLLTPLAAMLAGLGALAVGFGLIAVPAPNLFDSRLSSILIGIVTIAIALLGPGAFSLDSRFFGRREIIIPRRPES
jgi:uncharacterized membrane protein YphA (DoxX/SURF4 family)